MVANALDEPSIIYWLETRRETAENLRQAALFSEPQRWLEERTASPFYTASNPHTCEHCRQITVELAEESRKSRAQLPYGLPESILAARGGCVLYQAFVDLVYDELRREAKTDWPGDDALSFWIAYDPEELPDDTARLWFTVEWSSDTRSRKPLNDSGFTVWTLEGNPAAVHISTRPYELDYQSSASTAWGRSCVRYCQLNHSECRGSVGNDGNREVINPASIPSRLLRLYRDESGILLAQITGRDMQHQIPTPEVSRRGFAVLSYCWGGPQPIQLTRETATLAQVYPVTMLPKTLADAAWFTHQLGLDYLWVDALCIMQDEPDDKGREIPRMGQYYGDATVTICAALANTCSSGFLRNPPPAEDPTDYLFGPVELRVKTTTGKPGTIQILKEADYFSSHRKREPIVQRGWTLQESLLSRRLLIFSSHHFYFSCKVANASCGGREPRPKSRIIGTYESRVPGIHTIASLQRMYPVVSTWDNVVNEYTQRLLGFPGDKLPAVSAMAASLVRMARDERGLDLRYCAGLIFDLEGKDWGWKGELLWAVAQPGTPLETTSGTFSPSWSWASLQAPIQRLKSVPDNFPHEDGICLLDLSAPLADERNPFGAVKGGMIRLKARTRLFSTIDRAEMNVLMTRERNLDHDMYDVTSQSALVVRSDTAEGEKCYKRVGMFEFKVYHNPRSKATRRIALERARTLFDNCEPQELYLV
ncbi:HET-domain-containing protein [Xylariaceae sp. AK1471]|nr:HET-domain-containing protein [Xylariaceae sp. AK1471]